MSTKRRGKGEGGVYRPTYRDKRTGEARQQAVWWIRYRRTRGAKETCESSGSTDRRAASRLLAQRLADVSRGKAVGPEVTRTTFDDVARMLEDDYRVNARRSERRMLQSLTHLRAFFADMRAADIGPDTVTAYARQRVDAGAKERDRQPRAVRAQARSTWRRSPAAWPTCRTCPCCARPTRAAVSSSPTS